MPQSKQSPGIPWVGKERFSLRLVMCVVLGLALRVAYLVFTRADGVLGDGAVRAQLARLLAKGHGYVAYGGDGLAPSAHWPPAWRAILAIPASLGFESNLHLGLFAALIGSCSVALIGLAGRRMHNESTGVFAAAIAAIYPGFWVFERELLSEVLIIAVTSLVVLQTYRFWDRPTLIRISALAAAVAAAALVRSEQILMVVVLIFPVVLMHRQLGWRQRLQYLAASALIIVACFTPWFVHNNMSERFKEPVFMSTGLGGAMAAGSCDETFSGDWLGYYRRDCTLRRAFYLRSADLDDSEVDSALRKAAIDYQIEHIDRLPLVVLARLGRGFSLYRPLQTLGHHASWTSTREEALWLWLAAYWSALPAAVMGAVVLWRSGRPLYPLISLVVISAAAMTVTFGLPRYRVFAEVALVLLSGAAATGIVASRYGRKDQTEDQSRSLAGGPTGLTRPDTQALQVSPAHLEKSPAR